MIETTFKRERPLIAVGIPTFAGLPLRTQWDYMRMMYCFGRRYPEYDFSLLVKEKSEQFRARNAIVQTARVIGADYLLFLDDDHVFDYKDLPDHSAYDFLKKLLSVDKDIVGALYYHRGGEYQPVLMCQEGAKYRFLRDDEITGNPQPVDVQGGGVMLIKTKIFDKLEEPFFEPEMQTGQVGLGTDVQLCRKAAAAGFEIWCHTGVVVGHVRNTEDIVVPENRKHLYLDRMQGNEQIQEWMADKWLSVYRSDVREYTGYDDEEIIKKAEEYNVKNLRNFKVFSDKKEYYRQTGTSQICRQFFYHSKAGIVRDGMGLLQLFQKRAGICGLDYGCGSAPIGFELLNRGYRMDFVDIDGAPAYEFLKWRVERHRKQDQVGWSMRGPYDFAMFLDSIEHLENWQEVLDQAVGRLKPDGVLVTNYFTNRDFGNPEHVSMDQQAVQEFLLSREVYPVNDLVWVKKDNLYGPKHVGSGNREEPK